MKTVTLSKTKTKVAFRHSNYLRLQECQSHALIGAITVISSQDKNIALSSTDGSIYIASIEHNAIVETLVEQAVDPPKAICVACSNTNQNIVAGYEDGYVKYWDTKKKIVISKTKNHVEPVNAIAWSYDDTVYATGSNGGEIIIHNSNGKAPPSVLIDPNEKIHSGIRMLKMSKHNPSLLGAAYKNGIAAIWDMKTKTKYWEMDSHCPSDCTGIAFSSVNQMLFCTVGKSKKITFYDIIEKKGVKEIITDSPITSLSFHYDGKTVAVSNQNGSVLIYDLRYFSSPKHILKGHSQSVNWIEFNKSQIRSSNISGPQIVKLSLETKKETKQEKDKDTPIEKSPISSQQRTSITKKYKTIEEIRQEARIIVERKKKYILI